MRRGRVSLQYSQVRFLRIGRRRPLIDGAQSVIQQPENERNSSPVQQGRIPPFSERNQNSQASEDTSRAVSLFFSLYTLAPLRGSAKLIPSLFTRNSPRQRLPRTARLPHYSIIPASGAVMKVFLLFLLALITVSTSFRIPRVFNGLNLLRSENFSSNHIPCVYVTSHMASLERRDLKRLHDRDIEISSKSLPSSLSFNNTRNDSVPAAAAKSESPSWFPTVDSTVTIVFRAVVTILSLLNINISWRIHGNLSLFQCQRKTPLNSMFSSSCWESSSHSQRWYRSRQTGMASLSRRI